MALLELGGRGGQRYSLPQGEVLLGADPSCAISLAFPGVLPLHAKIKTEGDGQVVISKAVPEAEVLINGVRLGGEPTPLLHGDKVEVAGQELTFVDERRSGSTQYMHAITPQAAAQAKESTSRKATANTGGRVVSLTDGREYAIAGSSLVFGRDASCDVVVSGKDVSRRHAEIVQTPKGYVLVDSSTNGTSVNDARVEGQRLLARADVITIGEEKFRFYADTPAPAPAPSPPSQKTESGGATARLRETVHGMPAARPAGTSAPAPPPPPPAQAPRPSGGGGGGGGGALAAFVVRSGSLKGQRFLVRTPVVNIGRAEYNDLVLTDESVSTSHAKLQRREGVWVLIDLDSTNGTYVDGDQIKGEAALAPGAMVRFGEIGLVFEPTDDAAAVAKGGATRMMEKMTMEPAPAPKPAPKPPPPRPAAQPPKPVAAKPAAAKPVAARPVAARPKGAKPPAAQKKAKGCGASAVILLAMVGLAYWVFI